MGKQMFFIEVEGYMVGNFRDLICWQLLKKLGRVLSLNLGSLLLLGKPALSEAAAEISLKGWNVGVIRLIEDGKLGFLYMAIVLFGLPLDCTVSW